VRISITVIVEENGLREQGYAGGGARLDYGHFTEACSTASRARQSIRRSSTFRRDGARRQHDRRARQWLAGHSAARGDRTRSRGRLQPEGHERIRRAVGQRVAAAGVTVVDDGTLGERRGSLNLDDEGNPTQRTVLIEDGVLCGYMQDRLNAGLMKAGQTGNGRRESFAHLPMPRMTNTIMLPGGHDPAEIIASVKKGLYAANFGGGQVDITSGKFVFSAAEAWMIEDGKVTHPVKGATLIGNGPDALTRVSMVGNDLALDAGIGTCGKDGQSVPVGVGQPTLRIDGLTVGGTT
jgi:TldD protein